MKLPKAIWRAVIKGANFTPAKRKLKTTVTSFTITRKVDHLESRREGRMSGFKISLPEKGQSLKP